MMLYQILVMGLLAVLAIGCSEKERTESELKYGMFDQNALKSSALDLIDENAGELTVCIGYVGHTEDERLTTIVQRAAEAGIHEWNKVLLDANSLWTVARVHITFEVLSNSMCPMNLDRMSINLYDNQENFEAHSNDRFGLKMGRPSPEDFKDHYRSAHRLQ